MKKFVAGTYIVIGGAILLAVTFFLWPFMVPGILLRLLFGDKCSAWVTGVTGLLCVLVIDSFDGRLFYQTWKGPYEAIDTFVSLVVGTAIAVIIVRAGYAVADALIEGWKSKTFRVSEAAE